MKQRGPQDMTSRTQEVRVKTFDQRALLLLRSKGGIFYHLMCVGVGVGASVLMIEFVEVYVSSRKMDTRIYEYIFSFPCTVFQVQYSM